MNNEESNINQYGVNRQGLKLKLFDENSENPTAEQRTEKTELKLNVDTRPEKYAEAFDEEEAITENLIRTQSVSKFIDISDYKPVGPKPQGLLLTIFMILMYVFMILQLAILAWLFSDPGIDLLFNMESVLGWASVAPGLAFIDAILVNILYKRKISLVFVAWLVPFVYPLQRSKHIGNSRILGHLICWCFVLAIISMIFGVTKVGNKYGEAMNIQDEKTRHEVAAVMDQKQEEKRIGNMLLRNVDLYNFDYSQKNGVEYVIMGGTGNVYVDGNVLVEDQTVGVDTIFCFAKQREGNYKLVSAQLGNTEMTDIWLEQYWRYIME